MERRPDNRLKAHNEELSVILEDVQTRIEELQDEFTSALDDLEGMITEL